VPASIRGGFPLQYYGYGCIGGELSHLFVSDLGNKAGESVLTQIGDTAEQIANLSLFSNVQSCLYGSGTAYAPRPISSWGFNADEGFQGVGDNDYVDFFSLAVRAGDVAAAVPEPRTLALALLAFGASVMARKSRPA
jgi:hypothetical protein